MATTWRAQGHDCNINRKDTDRRNDDHGKNYGLYSEKMADKNIEKLPQVGTGKTGESHPSFKEGCPKDSGGDNLPCTEPRTEPVDPFKRRDSIQRSPPGQVLKKIQTPVKDKENRDGEIEVIEVGNRKEGVRQHSKHLAESKIVRSHSVGPSFKKRKAEEACESDISISDIAKITKDKTVIKITEALEMVYKQVKELEKRIMENPNTKREIKEISAKLKKGVDALTKSSTTDWIKTHIETTTPIKETEQKKIETENKSIQTTNRETQTEEEETEEDHVERKARSIRSAIQANEGIEGLLSIISEEWPEAAYQSVQEIQNNPLLAPMDYDVAVIITDKTNKAKGLTRQIIEIYPGVDDVIKSDIMGEKMIYIDNRINTNIGNTGDSKERTCYIINGGEEKENGINPTEIYETVVQIKERLIKKGKNKIAIAGDSAQNTEKLKKLLEYIFSNCEVEVKLCTPIRNMRESSIQNKKGEDRQEPKTRMGGSSARGGRLQGEFKRKIPRTEAVIIRIEGKSYEDMLRKVKTEVNLEGTGIDVEGIRKTNKGDLLLTIRGKGKADKLNEIVSQKLKDIKTITKKDERSIIYIQDLDAITTKQEIEEVIKVSLGNILNEEDININSLEKAYGDTQKATITLPNTMADDLIKKGRIKVGWTSCRIKEKIDIIRCHRCMQIGHTQRKCNGPDRGKNYLRCGSDGHIAKVCKAEVFCPICKEKGHRIDSGRCPVNRKALVEGRQRKNIKQRYSSPTPA